MYTRTGIYSSLFGMLVTQDGWPLVRVAVYLRGTTIYPRVVFLAVWRLRSLIGQVRCAIRVEGGGL